MTYYVRNLPHWQPDGAIIFATWRLYGSRLRIEFSRKHSGRHFVQVDRELDQARTGPVWLNKPEIARLVASSIKKGASIFHHYDLHAFVVMVNHVHVLIQPRVPLEQITKAIKGATAREANLILGRTGQPFWQHESFDHWIRNRTEFEKIRIYIEQNPVNAGFVRNPAEWPWSSAHPE